MNPDVSVCALDADVTRGLSLGAFRQMDVVLGCLDNRDARRAVNRACWQFGVPFVDGGLNALDGSVKVFRPPDGPCWECGLTDEERQWMAVRYSCPLKPADAARGRVPTTITSASIIAAVQVQEAVRILHGLAVEPGAAFLYSASSLTATRVRLARRRSCAVHTAATQVIELDARSDTLTLRELCRHACQTLGAGASLWLDRQVSLRRTCLNCGAVEDTLAPHVDGASATCGRCGSAMLSDRTHVIARETPHTDVPLSAVGIPPFHVVAARNDDREVLFEIAGDRHAVMNYIGGATPQTDHGGMT